eukprot:1161249-Pelagomonas_calceolata.AAC.2
MEKDCCLLAVDLHRRFYKAKEHSNFRVHAPPIMEMKGVIWCATLLHLQSYTNAPCVEKLDVCLYARSQTPPVLEMKEEYEMQVSAAASRQQARQRAQARAQQRQSSMHSRQLHLRQSGVILLALVAVTGAMCVCVWVCACS